jgi:hypothetical protein
MSGTKGRPTFTKTEHYFVFGKHVGIASERNPEKHRVIRKALSPAFSPRAIRAHDEYCHRVVDTALDGLERRGAMGEGANMSDVRLLVPQSFTSRLESMFTYLFSGSTGSRWISQVLSLTDMTSRISSTKSLQPFFNSSTVQAFGVLWTRPSRDSPSYGRWCS